MRFRTITRTRLRSLSDEVQVATLRDLYRDNLERLRRGLEFCQSRGIRLFRITSGLFPQSEDPPGFDVVTEFIPLAAEIGRRATECGLRLVRYHARVLDLLGQPRSAWATIEIHGGKGGRGDQLVEVINSLPEEIRSRLALENDEFAYSADEILDVCRRARVPMVFDAHHHLCHEGLSSYDDPGVERMTLAARETWPRSEWQLVHISNGREGLRDPRHSDFIRRMPAAFRNVPWIEVEAKQKERAIERLQRSWLRPP